MLHSNDQPMSLDKTFDISVPKVCPVAAEVEACT